MTPLTETPMREGSRDARQGGCLVCGKDVPSTRATYCTRAHQQRSYRLRHQTSMVDLTSVRTALQRRKALATHTIMPLCSRRAWTTFQGPLDPSRLTTCPHQVAATTGSSLSAVIYIH